VVICADSGKVLAMVWKEGKIEERTMLAARPPQYAWIPKLKLVSKFNPPNDRNMSKAETYKMKLTKHLTITTNHAPYIPNVALLIIEKPR
jgi:hypothetical protein